jgi:hypothetical protein
MKLGHAANEPPILIALDDDVELLRPPPLPK